MLIKTGILCLPEYDDEAVSAVRRLLASEVRPIAVLQEQRVGMVRNLVEELLRRWADEEELDLIVTIGGTLPAAGPSRREIVPEATLAVAERLMPGLSEVMRSYAATGVPLAWLDRGVAAIRGRTLILNLPAGADTAAWFLTPVVGLIAPVLAHLRDDPAAPSLDVTTVQPHETPAEGGRADPAQAPSSEPKKKELDPAEFAAFLKRRSQGEQ
jgi:molybdopterin biosynthesis enzyme MoaB